MRQSMKKLDVVIIKKYSDAVAKEILEFGDFESIALDPSKLQNYALGRENFEEQSSRLGEFRRRISSAFSFFSLPQPENVTHEKNELLADFDVKRDLDEIESKINRYRRDFERLEKRRNEVKIKLASIRFFGSMNTPVPSEEDVKHFYMGFGSVPSASHQAFIDAMSTLPSVVMNAGNLSEENMVFFTVPMTMKDKAEKILQNVYYQDYGIPQDVKGNIRSNIVKYGFEITMLDDESIWLEEQFDKMKTEYGKKLSLLSDSVTYSLSMSGLKGEMASTKSVYLFSGWVPSEEIENITKRIEEVSKHCCLFLDESAESVMQNEQIAPPTKLKNPKILKPFEKLVTMFGTPNYREIDPTPFSAILYFIMFGAMFGDVGHGLILSIVGLFLMWKKKMGMISKIMFWVGLSSAFFGWLYGGVFGHEFHLIDPLWMSPMDNIMTILIIAIAFGAAVLSLGIILGIINSARLKDYGKMLFSANGIAGLLLYWDVIAFALLMISGIAAPKVMLIIGLFSLLCIFFEKRFAFWFFKHGHKEPLAMGLLEVFEAVLNMATNTISFLRVGAFALNHGALMGAVSILSEMANGPIGQGIILVIGNIIVIVLEAMIVGIQSLRLEYYEFFIRFFRADGRSFNGLDIYKRNV